VFTRESWMDRSSCQTYPTEVFFPDESSRKKDKGREAMLICSTCPVRSECWDYACRFKVTHGVWAGVLLTPRGRRVDVVE